MWASVARLMNHFHGELNNDEAAMAGLSTCQWISALTSKIGETKALESQLPLYVARQPFGWERCSAYWTASSPRKGAGAGDFSETTTLQSVVGEQ
jgi:hypothetical protein